MTVDRFRAAAFLAGEQITLAEADALWRNLRQNSDWAVARAVISRLRDGLASDSDILIDATSSRAQRQEWCRQAALLTSKDPELPASTRHDQALAILVQEFDLDSPDLDRDAATLGIAGGICKRRWYDLGQLRDLARAAGFYGRAADGPLGTDAYAQINAAFLEDLLASTGDLPVVRRARAEALRRRIVDDLPVTAEWWNAASRAEAHFGLGEYERATAALAGVKRPAQWELESAARQAATIAELRGVSPLRDQPVCHYFEALLTRADSAAPQVSHAVRNAAVRSAFLGKVGLALSGGGFRASLYHLGVLARLAELDVLRHVDVLSCVSGGSIVGACYWLALRQRLIAAAPLSRADYIDLVQALITHFVTAVGANPRAQIQPSTVKAAFNVLVRRQQGLLDPETIADALERDFYRPLMPGDGPLFMHQLVLQGDEVPKDHDPSVTMCDDFNPIRDNWLRPDKVPALVLNATTMNTGHPWQFTPTWMGESPWALHAAADAVRRLDWAMYSPEAGWQIRLARAVAASACVPAVFSPLALAAPYEIDVDVRLVDGGVYDNQGTVALLAHNCNVLIVSDAAGQLMLEAKPDAMNLLGAAKRAADTLTERVRQANFGDLQARRLSGLARGLMFVHMKAGLDADPVRLPFAPTSYTMRRSTLSPSGVRKDFQEALAELRTDLDAFSPTECQALMACGYQMASKAVPAQLANMSGLWDASQPRASWVFDDLLREITSTAANTPSRTALLMALADGKSIRF